MDKDKNKLIKNKELNLGYIITGKTSEGTKYLSYDYSGGGCAYWSEHIQSAKIYKDIDEANKILQSSEFTKRSKMSDGTLDAPYLLRTLAGISIYKESEKVTISIKEIKLDSIYSKEFEVFDIKPKIVYDSELKDDEFKF